MRRSHGFLSGVPFHVRHPTLSWTDPRYTPLCVWLVPERSLRCLVRIHAMSVCRSALCMVGVFLCLSVITVWVYLLITSICTYVFKHRLCDTVVHIIKCADVPVYLASPPAIHCSDRQNERKLWSSWNGVHLACCTYLSLVHVLYACLC
jgi:hypothetical protein